MRSLAGPLDLRSASRSPGPAPGPGRRAALAPPVGSLAGARRHLLAHRGDVEAVLQEDALGQATFDPQHADQQVLRPDRGMDHALRLVRGIREDLLRLLGQRQFGSRRNPFDEDPLALDLPPQHLRLDPDCIQQLDDRLFALAQDAEKYVFGFDHPAAQLARLVARKEEGPPRFLVVLLEHAPSLIRDDDPATAHGRFRVPGDPDHSARMNLQGRAQAPTAGDSLVLPWGSSGMSR